MAPAAAEAIKDAKSLDALRADIGGLMAELASRPQVNAGRRKLSGPERAAMGAQALAFAARHRGATARTVGLLRHIIY